VSREREDEAAGLKALATGEECSHTIYPLNVYPGIIAPGLPDFRTSGLSDFSDFPNFKLMAAGKI